MGHASLKTDLVVALDFPTAEKAEEMMKTLAGLPIVYKIGLELFLGAGPDWVKKLTSSGHRIFLDLKFHDIPNTVAQAVLQAAHMGVESTTIHLVGGRRMLDEIELSFEEAEASGKLKKRPVVLGVTVLTSFKEEDWVASVSAVAKLSGIRSIDESVLHLATLAHDHPAVGGIVCSPKEIEAVRAKYPNLYLMVPGIRPNGTASHDQNRVMTPKDAVAAGASAIVVGRPILLADDPRAVAEQILKEIV